MRRKQHNNSESMKKQNVTFPKDYTNSAAIDTNQNEIFEISNKEFKILILKHVRSKRNLKTNTKKSENQTRILMRNLSKR